MINKFYKEHGQNEPHSDVDFFLNLGCIIWKNLLLLVGLEVNYVY
jgi:hypothetical protein